MSLAVAEPLEEEAPGLNLGDPIACGHISAWDYLGLCVDPAIDPAVFFPEGPGADISEPKRICKPCPVRLCCAADAIVRGDENGIWGGMSARSRRRARKLWLAGVPLRDAIARFDDP